MSGTAAPRRSTGRNEKNGGSVLYELCRRVSLPPLENIVKDLQREFGQPIRIVDKALGTTRHFASFVNEESLMEILDALCTHSGMRVEEKDNTIYIYNN